MTTAQIESPLAHLSGDRIEQLGREFDALHDEVFGDLGDRDRRYITSMIEMHRRLAVIGRVVLLASRQRPAWAAGTTALSLAKILENMEIGHNVMHGQWDWMNDPYIHSSTWDWDSASSAEAWKHSHNFIHHTYTNIRGKDKDLGYEIMRIDPHQRWNPVYLAQPLYNLLLMAFFEWGVAFHDLDLEAIRSGEKSAAQVREDLKGILGKARDQVVKDYVAWPLISAFAVGAVELARSSHGPVREAVDSGLGKRPRAAAPARALKARRRRRKLGEGGALALATAARSYKTTFWANFTANIVRNLWAHAIIFCGHFPDQTYTFSEAETEDESRGGWYVRQLVGAANIDGSPLFHVASGNLSYQVEHHLFPDMPSTRYAEIAPRVKEICERYGLPYNTGPFLQQWGMVQRTIVRLAFPGGAPRTKPGPYRGNESLARASTNGAQAAGDEAPPTEPPAPSDSPVAGPEQRSAGVRVSLPPRE